MEHKPNSSLRDISSDAYESGMTEIARDLEAHAEQKEALYNSLRAIIRHTQVRGCIQKYLVTDVLKDADQAVADASESF